jgi:hypothetical protein
MQLSKEEQAYNDHVTNRIAAATADHRIEMAAKRIQVMHDKKRRLTTIARMNTLMNNPTA